MHIRPGLAIVRLLPILFVTISAMAYVAWIEGIDAYVVRNVVPILVVIIIGPCGGNSS